MPQATGSNVAVGYQLESAFATDPGVPALTKLYYTGEGMQLSRNLIESNTIQSSRNPSAPILGNHNVSGQLSCELQAYIGRLLKGTLGACTTTGSDPYTHVIKVGPDIPSFTIEKGFTDLGTPQYMKYNGCKIGSMSLNIKPEGFQEISFNFTGVKETIGAASFDATMTDMGKQSWSGFEGSITEGGGAIATVMDASISIENGLDTSIYCIGGAGLRAALPPGMVKVTGNIKALFDSVTLYNKALAGTESALEFAFSKGTGDGSAGNEKLTITIPELIYEPKTPVVSGPSGVMIDLPFHAYYNTDAAASAIHMELMNTESVLT